ncbi:hypothetical protein ABT124_51165 [Streptomyces sp. NPDC001982]|uniref:hypothetical protein n=1 Tax=Streptomyces sp. NPDC001982 TaxID=3154405 RepID=UPI00331E7623
MTTPTNDGVALMFFRLMIPDHPRILLFVWRPVIAIAATSRDGAAHRHRPTMHRREPDASGGSVPRDPPPTEDMPQEVKAPSSAPEKGKENESEKAPETETDGAIPEPPD